MKVLMKKAKETKGAVVFTEVDQHGNELQYGQYKIGTLYIRKTAQPPSGGIEVEIKPTSFVEESK